MINVLPLSVVILAAGKGTRMKSTRAKVLHEVFYRPMLHHVLNAVQPIKPTRSIVIVGHQEQTVRDSLKGYDVEIVRQEQQLGTGHAVLMTKEAVPDDGGLVLILCGDTPLISSSSIQEMYENHIEAGADLSVMTTKLGDPTGYGRIISTGKNVTAIVEEKEADSEQKGISEINSGIYLVERKLLFEALENITPENSQGEFYLTDIVQYAVAKNKTALKHLNTRPTEVLGVNSRVELEEAHAQLQRQRNVELMQSGVSIHNSATVSVSPFSEVGIDSLIMQNVVIKGESVVGKSCIIENGSILKDCVVGDNVRIEPYCVLEGCSIASDSRIDAATIRTVN